MNDVKKIDGRTPRSASSRASSASGRVHARVPRDRRRDTERNHTATHLLHAALRQVLGEHVHAGGIARRAGPAALRLHHHGPIKPEQLAEIEEIVNRGIWAT